MYRWLPDLSVLSYTKVLGWRGIRIRRENLFVLVVFEDCCQCSLVVFETGGYLFNAELESTVLSWYLKLVFYSDVRCYTIIYHSYGCWRWDTTVSQLAFFYSFQADGSLSVQCSGPEVFEAKDVAKGLGELVHKLYANVGQQTSTYTVWNDSLIAGGGPNARHPSFLCYYWSCRFVILVGHGHSRLASRAVPHNESSFYLTISWRGTYQ